MMSVLRPLILLVTLFLCAPMLQAQPASAQRTDIALDEIPPMSPQILTGTLENGLTWYVRSNRKPENRAHLRLVVNAGSVLETEEQLGLAHFCEHMAFNGTANFQKQALVDYLESIGMRFGAGVNAYTSFDETVYFLELPMDDEAIVEKGIQILVDWASALSFEEEEIDKERGVIIEEWRVRSGAGTRIRDKQFPVILRGSLYADRLPIGKPEIIENFAYETLRSYYRDWYRPDLMAVIAVGDFDAEQMRDRLVQAFSGIPPAETPVERPTFDVPDHDELLVTVESDPELTSTSLTVYHKRDPEVTRTVSDFRRSMVNRMLFSMLSDRLTEIRQKPDAPFLFAYATAGGFLRSKDVYRGYASVKDNEVERGLERLLMEQKRVLRHGFTETELERAKAATLRSVEQSYIERDKYPSSGRASELTRHFLTGESAPGIEYEWELYQRFVPEITLEEINARAADLMAERNRVIAVSLPQKEGLTPPSEESLRAVFARVENMDLDPWQDDVLDKPLAEVPESDASIVEEKQHESVDVTEWRLSNGIRVFWKTTDFKENEIQFQAWSPGGESLAPDEMIQSAEQAVNLVTSSGVGDFTDTQLEKRLTGKLVSVRPYISNEDEGLSGSTTPEDLETLFQLIHLYFTAPRLDEDIFTASIQRSLAYIKHARNNPSRVFGDTISRVLSCYHPRVKLQDEEYYRAVSRDEAFAFFKDRFADAGDFTFAFVGNIDEQKLRDFVTTYLGALPVTGRQETWKDNGIERPKGVVKKEVHRGVDQKSTVLIYVSGPFEWTEENRYLLGALGELLRIRLREEIREEKGGTYGVGAYAYADQYPKPEYNAVIQFGTDPDRVHELLATTYNVLTALRDEPVSEDLVKKIQEIQRRDREEALKENSFWLGSIRSILWYGDDFGYINRFDERVNSLTPERLQEAVRTYLPKDRYVEAVLFPSPDASGDASGEME